MAFDKAKLEVSSPSSDGVAGSVELSDSGRNVLLEDGKQATSYTVTASANPGYEYDGYTLTTASGTETAAWDSVSYTYDTKESGSDNMRDSRRSTATFDVTITEDATLDFHFKEMDIDALFAQMGEETSIDLLRN